jgi:radical SAM superfamily enzyme YgiQ (UPF0313 family)
MNSTDHSRPEAGAAAKKIFLGNAPWSKPGYKGVRAGCRWPHFELAVSPYMPFPFYLGHATALLKKNGFEVLLIDAIAEQMDEETYFSRMAAFAPDLVVHEVSTASIESDVRQARLVKEKIPRARLVFCGPHQLMYEPAFLTQHPFVDYVIEGEYEFPLLELAQKLDASKDGILGLIFRPAEGTPKANGRRPLIALDSLPWPAREFLPMAKYYDNMGGIPSPSLQMHASRGCPFTCNFCSWPQVMYGGNAYRTRSSKDVVDELEACIKLYGIKSFYFDDDTFNIGKKRMLELADELIRRKINLPWSAMARADTADEETLQRMHQAGLVSIKYGVESGDQKILDDCGKRLDLAVARRNILTTKRLGIKCHLSFAFGLPGETRETIQKTLRLADELDPDSLQFSIATPYPGSRLYDQLKAEGHLLTGDFNEYDGANHSVLRTTSLTPQEIETAQKNAIARWHKKHLVRKLWRNKVHYTKECLRHPLVAARIVGNMITAGKQSS